jgi:SAM-dependent methyltransferase
MATTNDLVPRPAADLSPFHSGALAAIRKLPGYPSLSFLELGCGDGILMERLSKDGATQLKGTTFRDRDDDYIRQREHPAYLRVDTGIDLNRALPYPDASFDVVYSTEVIEHVEGHRNVVSEAARVLRPGGWFVLTTPNLHRIVSRVNFALSGVHLTKQALIPWTYPLGRMEEFHHRCVDFPLLHWLLWNSGMRVIELSTAHVHFVSKVAALLQPLLTPITRKHVMRHVSADGEDRAAREDLIRWMTRGSLLIDEHICLTARKAGGPLASR